NYDRPKPENHVPTDTVQKKEEPPPSLWKEVPERVKPTPHRNNVASPAKTSNVSSTQTKQRADRIGPAEPGRKYGERASLDPSEQDLIDWVAGVDGEIWFAIARWAKKNDHFQGWERRLLFSIGRYVSNGW